MRGETPQPNTESHPSPQPSPSRGEGAAIVVLATLTLARLLVAAFLPLAPDEAYYWVWSRALAPGYLDHPPMVALWIRLGTTLAGDTPFGVRLLAPLSAAVGSLLLVQAAKDLLPGPGAVRRGLVAAALMNATLLFGVGAVTMTPDTPLLFFWTLCLAALARLVATGQPRWWLAAGLAAGLALDSKYTAALLAPALLIWVVAIPGLRAQLRHPYPWAAAIIAAALFAPVLAWNAAHQWASLAKQGGRAGDWQPARAAQFIGEIVAGQIGLATPLVAILAAVGIVVAIRRAIHRDPAWSLLAALTAIPAVVFLQHALGDRVQANWPAIIYPAAAIAAAALPSRWSRLFTPAIASGLAITFLVWLQAIAAPFPLPRRLDPTLMRLGGWPAFAGDIAAEAWRDKSAFVAADNYGDAAILARLLPPDLPVLGAEARWSTFALPAAAIAGTHGLLVRSARRADPPDSIDWSDIVPAPDIVRGRGGTVAEIFHVYRVTGRPTPTATIVTLPRPEGVSP